MSFDFHWEGRGWVKGTVGEGHNFTESRLRLLVHSKPSLFSVWLGLGSQTREPGLTKNWLDP